MTTRRPIEDDDLVDAVNRNTAQVRRIEDTLIVLIRAMGEYVEQMRKVYDELLAAKKRRWWW